MTYKLGSLFDGSGGFPLAGSLCGIEPIWASEVEPYPIAVTRSRFPNVKHLGDISKIHGGEIEPVDIITFGSPCQDLSVAGKRAGLKHEANGDEETTRSGLFMEAVRIIKEMREATDGEYPRFALWENVPGAFSSNKGEDFRIVLEELIRVTTPDASMPPVPKAGWNYADSYVFDGGSLAYRVLDAQYWGVPQRRRRIYLVADFRGECAREILFEREGLRGYFAEGRTPWQTTPADAQGSTGADDTEGTAGRGRQLDAVGFINAIGGNAENSQETQVSPTLTNGTAPGFQNAVAYSFDSLASNSMKSANPHSGCREVEVAKTLDTTDPNPSKNQGGLAIVEPVPYTLKIRSGCAVDSSGKAAGKGALIQENKAATLATTNDQYLFQPIDPTCIIDNIGGQAEYGKESQVNGTLRAGCQGAIAYAVGDKKVSIGLNGESQVCPTLIARMETATGTTQDGLILCEENPVICLQGNGIDRADTAGCNGKGWREDASYTLNTIDRPAVVYAVDQGGGKSGANVSEDTAPTLCTTHGGEPAVAYGTDVGWLNSCEGQSPTLLARQYKDPHLVTYTDTAHYIVRRLTPTECARLQGFADWWGYLEAVDKFSQKDYQFLLKARHTHEVIVKGKDPNDLKEYTVKQMLTWYNKLWTDSAEYKMWGNGIALPTALYCLQGIAEALERAKSTTPTECADLRGIDAEEEDAWML